MREIMKNLLPKPLLALAKRCPFPLYVVGGAVRDLLAGLQSNIPLDWDICSPTPFDQFLSIASECGFTAKSIFRSTGTVKLFDEGNNEYEYCSFRSDKYIRGTHVPVEIFFTDDIQLDARRRDFTANAVYFDVNAAEFVDPLNGIAAIQEKRLTTVAPAQKVFGEDGLRLMRLARQAACLGFTPDDDCLAGARANASLIEDITAERIYTELKQILSADKKYGVTDGHYRGLKLLEDIGVLEKILPELSLGKNMPQRADFHKYDVLEHSLRAVLYAEEEVRLAALLHDVGKPFCTLRDGNAYAHPQEGARIAVDILTRLKAPKKTIQRVHALVQHHMYDMNCQTGENKLRRFFATNLSILDDLLLLKQADFSACMDDLSPAPTCVRWQAVLKKMQEEHAPLQIKDLSVSGKTLLDANIPAPYVATVLNALLLHTAVNPKDNQKERLIKIAQGIVKNLAEQ